MALIIKSAMDLYSYAMTEWSDPRVADFFLMEHPFPTIIIIGLYLHFVLQWGPNYMKNRNSFNIDKILIIYNIIQVVLCIYIVQVFFSKIFFVFNLCEPVDTSNSEQALAIVSHIWMYFIIKLVDLLDTVFFVLRKKQNQVTFLHVYHHAGMVALAWFATKFLPGGSGVFVGGVNCLVHTVMYSYYLLTVWDKKYKKSIWWKKHITQLQLLQFGFIFVLFTIILFSDCGYPRWISLVLIPQNLFMFVLFGDFYIKAYVKKKPTIEQVNKTSEMQDAN